MEILASNHFLTLSPLSIKSFSIKTPISFLSTNPNSIQKSKPTAVSCSIAGSQGLISSNYNGWDDLELLEDPSRSVKVNFFQSFLISLGLDDSKLALAFCIGFISALAVSRLRFSFMIVLPVSILASVAGYSAGEARARVSGAKVRDLEGFLKDLMLELEQGADFSLDQLDMSKVESLLEGIESLKKNVEGSVVGEMINEHFDFNLGWTKKGNPKPSKKRKEFDFIRYVSELFQENVIGARTPKMNDNSSTSEQSNSTLKTNPTAKESAFADVIKDQESDRIEESELLFNKNTGKLKEEEDKVRAVRMQDNPARNINEFTNDRGSYRSNARVYDSDTLSYEERRSNLNRNFRFMTKQESFQRRVFEHNYEHQTVLRDIGGYAHSDTDKSSAESLDFFTVESEASSLLEEALQITNNAYNHLDRSGTKSSPIREPRVKFEEQSVKATQPVQGSEASIMPSSSTISHNDQFSKYMEDATGLLKQARECMRSQAEEETVDSILYKSEKLFSAAEAMRPMSLLAVGQLGNTFLLHGELKLRISRELRTLLLRSDASLNGKGRVAQLKNLNTCKLSRENVQTTLIDLCEECEELLVGAGRKYRTVLSIDGNDVRALYNWGLALSFRAQLIADIGPEAALDADKIYLAAIDKFDAMMSRSNHYSTDALYRWGLVLQQRADLRPRNNREKKRLLHQAKSLFEDVLAMESDNLLVREALVTCVSELNYSGQR